MAPESALREGGGGGGGGWTDDRTELIVVELKSPRHPPRGQIGSLI